MATPLDRPPGLSIDLMTTFAGLAGAKPGNDQAPHAAKRTALNRE